MMDKLIIFGICPIHHLQITGASALFYILRQIDKSEAFHLYKPVFFHKRCGLTKTN